jgi:hypothetical protein
LTEDQVGAKVELTFIRDGEKLTLEVVPEESRRLAHAPR